MKNILIVADGIVAKHFLERLFVSRSSTHHYVVIACGDEDYSDVNLENFTFYRFDPTSLDRLRQVASGYFSQFMIMLKDGFDTVSVYNNLRQISKKTEILILDLWGLGGLEDDSHLTVLDARAVLTARLMDFLPDIPVVADNLGLGKGEIMEVKVPVGSSFMYRHISSITQKKWRIAMIYRGSNFMIAKPNLMILPGDVLLIVGEPSVLLSVFRSVKKETGQFPNPFGHNIYLFLDMKKMGEKLCIRLLEQSLKLHEKLNNRRLFVKVVNPALNLAYEKLKSVNDEMATVMFDYFGGGVGQIKDDVFKNDVGLVVTDNKFFAAHKRLLFELKKPVAAIGKSDIDEIKKGVVLSSGFGDEIESQSAVIMDCCSQLDMPITLYHFGRSGADEEMEEHFDSLAKIFGRKIEVVEDKNSNPILRLKKERNLLQFVPFTKKISKKDAFAAFSNDMNRLYARLSDNYQIFIPIN